MAISHSQSVAYTPQSVNRHAQRDIALSLGMAFVIVLLLVQLWLLVAALEGFLGGDETIAVPATMASAVCFLGAWRLWATLRQKL